MAEPEPKEAWTCGICGGVTDIHNITCDFCGEPKSSAFNREKSSAS